MPTRTLAFPGAVAALAAFSLWFYYRQNFAGQIGGAMSVAKLLWLDYTLLAWFIVPFFVWRSALVRAPLRDIYAVHLANFCLRGAVELWMLYVSISWLPPYGIAHDFFSVGLITGLVWLRREKLRALGDRENRAARRFLVSIRAGLLCEIALAWLFFRATEGKIGIYFASDEPKFALINNVTWVAVLFAYSDLVVFLRRAAAVFFPVVNWTVCTREVERT
ncbi:MAG TPA: hypothetical protein VNL14_06580 [Candidatus Acidoferrales bacterium]|nr:hypothetical protein [Candidatus Acidoferrales bacterium]